jgi:hypothetical protein
VANFIDFSRIFQSFLSNLICAARRMRQSQIRLTLVQPKFWFEKIFFEKQAWVPLGAPAARG